MRPDSSGCCCALLITLSLFATAIRCLRHVANGWNHFPPPDVESTNPFGQFTVVSCIRCSSARCCICSHDAVRRRRRALAAAGWSWPRVFPASAAIMAMTSNAGAALNPVGIASLVGDLGGDYVEAPRRQLAAQRVHGAHERRAVVSRRLRGDGGRLDEPRAVPRDGCDVARASLRARSPGGRSTTPSSASEQRAARAMAEDPRSRLRVGAQRSAGAGVSHRSRSSSTAKATASRSISGRSTACWPGTIRGTRRCSASVSRQRLWQAGRKIDALELAQRCRKLSPSFVPPAAFTAELAAYARELGRHRLADELAELAAAKRSASS